MNAFWRLIRPNSNPPAGDESSSSDNWVLGAPDINALLRTTDGADIADPTSDAVPNTGSRSARSAGHNAGGPLAMDRFDIDAGTSGDAGANSNADAGGSPGFNLSNYFGSLLANLGNDTSAGDIDPADNSGDDSVDSSEGSENDPVDDSGGNGTDPDNNGGGNIAMPQQSFATSQYKGDGAATDLQGFNRRPYSKNSEDIFGTSFDPNNATAAANGGMNIHMQGNAGAEITAAQNATAYGSYTTTTKSMDVHGANQTGFFYGDGRKFEVDLFEPALKQGDVNTFTSGMWLDNVKVAETSIKASDLGFKSFHDQPMTYKMDFQPGNIKISALNSKGEWQTIVDHSDPRISDQLARDTNFKQMFSAWGINGEYNGAPVDFQVLKTGYSAQTV